MKKNFFFVMLSIIAFLVTSCSQDFEDGAGNINTNRSAKTKDYLLAFKTVDESKLNTRAAMLSQRWEDNQVITIGFLNGSESAKNRVKEVSKEWEDLINLKFKFVDNIDEKTLVKIGFSYNYDMVNWSYIGTQCVDYHDLNEPTMNILLFEENDASEINSQDFAGLILRNFGYMLGLVNEHQNPNSQIILDKSKTTREFQKSGWTVTQINNWLTKKYPASALSGFTDYDENSIMALFIPAYITTDGVGSDKFNNTLSNIDKEFIKKMYPKLMALPYEVGTRGSIYMTLPADYYAHGWNFDTETGADRIEKSYKTIGVGEYTWTAENLKIKYNLYGETNLTSFNFTQEKVNEITGTKGAYTVKQFEDIFGTWVTEYQGTLAYRNNLKFYTSNGGSEITGFDLPDVGDIMQLIGQAPVKTGNVYEDLRNFLYASPVDVMELSGNTLSPESSILKIPFIANSESISKLNITPLGFRKNAIEIVGESEPYSFGYGFGLRMKDYARMFKVGDAYGIRIYEYSYHFSQARYCKKYTAAELGYELYYSETNDDVIVLAPTEAAPAGYQVLPKGLERGITLRYSNIRPSNKGEKVVTESWSTIKAEAARIKKSISIVG